MSPLLATTPLEIGTLITQLGGGLALFLFGMRLIVEALKSVAESGMKNLPGEANGQSVHRGVGGHDCHDFPTFSFGSSACSNSLKKQGES